MTHPDWCLGGDHEPLVADDYDGGEREHYALVANGVGWPVEMTRSVYGGETYVSVRTGDHEAVIMHAERARTLGVALIRAADLDQTDGCAR